MAGLRGFELPEDDSSNSHQLPGKGTHNVSGLHTVSAGISVRWTKRHLEVRILSAQPLQHRRWKVWPVFSIPTGPAHLRQIAQRQAAIKIAPSLTSQREKAQKTIRRYVVEVER